MVNEFVCSKLYYIFGGWGYIYGNHYCVDDLEHLNFKLKTIESVFLQSVCRSKTCCAYFSVFHANNLLFLWQYDDWRDVQHFQTTAPTSGVQQPVLENLDFEVQSKLDGVIENNIAS